MTLNISFYEQKSEKYYTLFIPEKIDMGVIWLTNQDGEGGEFSADEITDAVYSALDKYFKEKL